VAIGSEPEIGAEFKLYKDKTPEEKQAFWDYMREHWHPYLMNGYATLVHNKDNPYYRGKDVK
jgi:hypothetical protein